MLKLKDKIWTGVLYIVSGFVVILLSFFNRIYTILKVGDCLNPYFLFGDPKVGEAGGGIGPQLFNSFYMLVVSLINICTFWSRSWYIFS